MSGNQNDIKENIIISESKLVPILTPDIRGKITSGERGKLKSLPYFNINRYDEVIKYYGNKPEQLLIRFPFEDLSSFLMYRMDQWGKNKRTTRTCNREHFTVSFRQPDPENKNIYYEPGKSYECQFPDCKCGVFFTFNCFICNPETARIITLNLVRFESHSMYNANRILSSLKLYKQIVNKVPFLLTVTMVKKDNRQFPQWSIQPMPDNNSQMNLDATLRYLQKSTDEEAIKNKLLLAEFPSAEFVDTEDDPDAEDIDKKTGEVIEEEATLENILPESEDPVIQLQDKINNTENLTKLQFVIDEIKISKTEYTPEEKKMINGWINYKRNQLREKQDKSGDKSVNGKSTETYLQETKNNNDEYSSEKTEKVSQNEDIPPANENQSDIKDEEIIPGELLRDRILRKKAEKEKKNTTTDKDSKTKDFSEYDDSDAAIEQSIKEAAEDESNYVELCDICGKIKENCICPFK